WWAHERGSRMTPLRSRGRTHPAQAGPPNSISINGAASDPPGALTHLSHLSRRIQADCHALTQTRLSSRQPVRFLSQERVVPCRPTNCCDVIDFAIVVGVDSL